MECKKKFLLLTLFLLGFLSTAQGSDAFLGQDIEDGSGLIPDTVESLVADFERARHQEDALLAELLDDGGDPDAAAACSGVHASPAKEPQKKPKSILRKGPKKAQKSPPRPSKKGAVKKALRWAAGVEDKDETSRRLLFDRKGEPHGTHNQRKRLGRRRHIELEDAERRAVHRLAQEEAAVAAGINPQRLPAREALARAQVVGVAETTEQYKALQPFIDRIEKVEKKRLEGSVEYLTIDGELRPIELAPDYDPDGFFSDSDDDADDEEDEIEGDGEDEE